MKNVRKSEEEQSSLSGVRFTKRCVCGNELQAAYNAELDIVFWNCFRCFPIYPKANHQQEEQLRKEFGIGSDRNRGMNETEEQEDSFLLDTDEYLDQAELNRLAYLAECPERMDPVFLFVRESS